MEVVHRLNSDSEAENEFLKGWEVEVLNVLNRKSKLKIFINSDHQFKGIGKISLDYVNYLCKFIKEMFGL